MKEDAVAAPHIEARLRGSDRRERGDRTVHTRRRPSPGCRPRRVSCHHRASFVRAPKWRNDASFAEERAAAKRARARRERGEHAQRVYAEEDGVRTTWNAVGSKRNTDGLTYGFLWNGLFNVRFELDVLTRSHNLTSNPPPPPPTPNYPPSNKKKTNSNK